MSAVIEERRWDKLSKKEATAILDAYVAGHSSRLAKALAEFASFGVAPAELDFSRRSLERIWTAVLEHYGTLPETPDPLVEDEVPYWVPFRVSFALRIGYRLCWTISYLADYFAECVFRQAPLSEWAIAGQKSSADYRQPVLHIHNGPTMVVEDVVSVGLTRALERADQWGIADAQPDGLRRQFDSRLAIDPDTPLEATAVRQIPTAADQDPAIRVEQVELGVFYLQPVDDVDDETSEQLDTIVERLSVALPHATVQREDRELIIVIAPNTTHDALASIVDGLLKPDTA